MSGYRLGVALMGKGATNHLHREEVVQAFRARKISVTFLVREDYLSLLDRIPDCAYVACRVEEPTGVPGFVLGLLRYMRGLYPSGDPGMRERFRIANRDRDGWRQRALHALLFVGARLRAVMLLAVLVEGFLYRGTEIAGPAPDSVDQLLLLGIGTAGTEAEAALTRWAQRHGVDVVHAVGNYDGMSSKGFRAVPVSRLLVWGASMREDAQELQGIPEDCVTEIGAVRYDRVRRGIRLNRADFLSSLGLDPARPVVLFAGSRVEYHYFEMLEAWRGLQDQGTECQLIIRIYPTKRLMSSPYIEPLLAYARSLPGVYVSIGDPHYRVGERDREVLRIEEEELWHALCYADVVVNLYSTLALEACIFDKPVINMWYFRGTGQLLIRKPVYTPYPLYYHIRKLVGYGGTRQAQNRDELLAEIKKYLANPGRDREGRARTVRAECGALDGCASERLAQACIEEYSASKTTRRSAADVNGIHARSKQA